MFNDLHQSPCNAPTCTTGTGCSVKWGGQEYSEHALDGQWCRRTLGACLRWSADTGPRPPNTWVPRAGDARLPLQYHVFEEAPPAIAWNGDDLEPAAGWPVRSGHDEPQLGELGVVVDLRAVREPDVPRQLPLRTVVAPNPLDVVPAIGEESGHRLGIALGAELHRCDLGHLDVRLDLLEQAGQQLRPLGAVRSVQSDSMSKSWTRHHSVSSCP